MFLKHFIFVCVTLRNYSCRYETPPLINRKETEQLITKFVSDLSPRLPSKQSSSKAAAAPYAKRYRPLLRPSQESVIDHGLPVSRKSNKHGHSKGSGNAGNGDIWGIEP
jgi:hypothetical protein